MACKVPGNGLFPQIAPTATAGKPGRRKRQLEEGGAPPPAQKHCHQVLRPVRKRSKEEIPCSCTFECLRRFESLRRNAKAWLAVCCCYQCLLVCLCSAKTIGLCVVSFGCGLLCRPNRRSTARARIKSRSRSTICLRLHTAP
jgi:hypothetical protein